MYKQVGVADSALMPVPAIDFKDGSGYRLIPLTPTETEVAHRAYGDVVPGDWGLAQFIAVKSGGFIHLHTDPPRDETKGRIRHHVVLQTNPYCWNYHDGDMQHLEEGGVYTVDEKVEHASVNWGKTPRVHLVIDVKETK